MKYKHACITVDFGVCDDEYNLLSLYKYNHIIFLRVRWFENLYVIDSSIRNVNVS
jgi:hypothetical protein